MPPKALLVSSLRSVSGTTPDYEVLFGIVDAGSQMLKGVLPTVALALLDQEDAYGYGVVQQLRAAGLASVGEASVYGVLQRLHDGGDLSTYQVASESGPPRRYYAVTPAGRANLEGAREEWESFAHSVNLVLGRERVGQRP